jgi:predicted lipoprotein with Yx(FWY)xxD motif
MPWSRRWPALANPRGEACVSPGMRLSLAVPVVLLASGLALAGGTYAVAHGGSATAASKHAVVNTRPTALGTVLVDGQGRTLYRFLKDTGRRSRCSGACAQNWPPQITSGRPRAAGRAKASLLSTVRRAGGARQVDYAGHPLYRFSLDSGPGKTSGQGVEAFGGRWYVVAPSGRVITKTSAGGYGGAPSSSPSAGGY